MQTITSNNNKGLFGMGVLKRGIIIWAGFQVILWLSFGISYFLNLDAWRNIFETGRSASGTGGFLGIFLTIVGTNLILFIAIIIGNMFVRFGSTTPSLVILLIQGITIGYVAGSNAFEFPFASVMEANLQYLKVGLWETTAYSLICAVTMTKSLYISDTFPAKKWTEVRKLRDIHFSKGEKIVALISLLLLIIAGCIEAAYIVNI